MQRAAALFPAHARIPPSLSSAQETEIFYEVAGKWVVTGDVEVNIGANASAGAIPCAALPSPVRVARCLR